MNGVSANYEAKVHTKCSSRAFYLPGRHPSANKLWLPCPAPFSFPTHFFFFPAPSRFDTAISFSLPDKSTRALIFKQYARQLSNEDVTRLAESSHGWVGR